MTIVVTHNRNLNNVKSKKLSPNFNNIRHTKRKQKTKTTIGMKKQMQIELLLQHPYLDMVISFFTLTEIINVLCLLNSKIYANLNENGRSISKQCFKEYFVVNEKMTDYIFSYKIQPVKSLKSYKFTYKHCIFMTALKIINYFDESAN